MSTNERDELADLLMSDKLNETAYVGRDYALAEADAILAAGYRRPRTITTVEELDALPKAATILDGNGAPLINDGDDLDPWCSPIESFEGGPCWFNSSSVSLPATVLHEPEPQP